MLKKALWAALIAALVLIPAGFAFWFRSVKPYLLLKKARFGNMQRLGEAVMLFNGKYNRLPASLEEMVAGGVLAENTPLCYSPIKHGSLDDVPVPARACEFSWFFHPRAVVIRIPQDQLAGPAGARLPESWRYVKITDTMLAWDPSEK